jgi:hypothetical protein
MHLIKKILLAAGALSLSGCVGLITGNTAVDATNYTAAGLIDGKAAREKQTQKDFQQDLEKKTQRSR